VLEGMFSISCCILIYIILQEPHEHCTDVPKEHCDYVKVKVAKRWCLDPKEEDDKKDSGKKIWKKLGKLIGH
jgi:hypothetical protein